MSDIGAFCSLMALLLAVPLLIGLTAKIIRDVVTDNDSWIWVVAMMLFGLLGAALLHFAGAA